MNKESSRKHLNMDDLDALWNSELTTTEFIDKTRRSRIADESGELEEEEDYDREEETSANDDQANP